MAEPRDDREQKTKSTQERLPAERKEGRSSGLAKRNDFPILHSPFDLFRRMSNEMDRMFHFAPFGRDAWAPEVEMFERDGKLIVRADLPGLNKEDVKVELRDDVLTIEGERRNEREEKREGFYHSERTYGSFFRSIPLPEGVKAEHPSASFRNGVLEVTLDAPKHKDAGAKRIEVT